MKKILSTLLVMMVALSATAQTTYYTNKARHWSDSLMKPASNITAVKLHAMDSVMMNAVDSTLVHATGGGGGTVAAVPLPPYLSGINQHGNFYFFGNSHSHGAGATDSAHRYTSVFCKKVGATEHNFGIAGSTLMRQSPIDYQGATNMIDRLSAMPTFSSSVSAIVLEFGDNDAGQNGVNYTVANFKIAYDSVLHYAANKGIPMRKIIVASPFWIGHAGDSVYGTINGNTAPTKQHVQDFVDAAYYEAAKWQTLYWNEWQDFLENDTTLLVADQIHRNNAGHDWDAYSLQRYLGFQTDTLIPAVGTPLAFTTVTNIAESPTGTWASTASSNAYGNTGLASVSLAASTDGRVFSTVNAQGGAALGFNSTNAQAGYNSMEAAALLDAAGNIYVIDASGTPAGFNGTPIGTASVGNLVGVHRVGSTFTIEKSVNGGTTWTVVGSPLTYSSTAQEWITIDILAGPTAAGKATDPKKL